MSSSSIIKVGSNLIVTVPEEISDNDAMSLQEEINERIERMRIDGVLLDITSLETVDSFLGRLLHEISAGAGLLGARTVVAGMQPAVAMTLVELGFQLRGVLTALDPDRGLAMLARNGHGP
ncbi:MAG TPA: STAS domain-containing protein [Dehalococcoidia bacterium]|nr:STAS domain-containing protein [Dehalococcoidia bacterium]